MIEHRFLDPRSVAGKHLVVAEACQVLVIGGGPAGLAAAVEAASRGAQVVLVDENPVPPTTMGEDVPLHFGGAVSPLARNRNAMTEAFVASDPAIEAAFEAGVDVRLGTTAWGLYANGESVGWLPGLMAGLADTDRSWLLRCERVIVAAGRRDMGIAFPGWDKPGVLGATAAERLATRYGALAATRAVILGTTAEALVCALALRGAGVEVAALVEQADAAVGPPELLASLARTGTEILTRHVVREALGRDAVQAVVLSAVNRDGSPVPGARERRIACDAVVLGIGAVPVIELLDALGCRVAFQPERGGYAPVLDSSNRTSVPHVWAVGDACGIWPAKSLVRALAEAEGRAAGSDAAASLGPAAAAPAAAAARPVAPALDMEAYRLDWVRASVVRGSGEPYVCQCEEVTAREILEVRPPRYLGAASDRRNDRSLISLLGEGPPNPDQVKRLTRAGMGPCQGRRCREQVACLLALGAGTGLGDVPLAGYRAPVRPLSLALAADGQEAAEMAAEWDTWFGIAPQYRLAEDLPPLYTVAAGKPAGPVASE
jgi:thioredoxin reductase